MEPNPELEQQRGLTRSRTIPVGSLWLVGHRALRDVPRVRSLWDFIVERAKAFET